MDKTVQYKRTLRGSVGAGMGSLFNGSGRRYYILEHKDASKFHKAGESQKIIIDQIELGRSSSCQVQFDDTFPTVSRRHAAIVKEGDRWKLVQLSQTNSTLLNGRKVENEWYLENGDEIQLSVGGPRMGFIVPQGKQSLVSSIKMTERLELFRKQALRPYKTAIACLAVLLVLSVGGLGGWNIIEHNRWQQYQIEAQARQDSLQNGLDSTVAQLSENKRLTDSLQVENEKKNKELVGKSLQMASAINNLKTNYEGIANDEALKKAINSVYYIIVEMVNITYPDGQKETLNFREMGISMTGSGFLLSDGRFVTARHVADPWAFINNPYKEALAVKLNNLACSGVDVETVFGAYSPTHSFSFTNKQCIINTAHDQSGSISIDLDEDGEKENYNLRIARLDETDWACIHTSLKGSIKPNSALSTTLKQQTKLLILGYPHGFKTDNVKSIQGSCRVASEGLYKGVIVITERNFEPGNSGGPVFKVCSDGSLEAIGIISAGYGDTVGFIVPIANVK